MAIIGLRGKLPTKHRQRYPRNMAMPTSLEALHPGSESPQPRHITEMRGLGKAL
jgi:hypothetical protein